MDSKLKNFIEENKKLLQQNNVEALYNALPFYMGANKLTQFF